MHDQWRGNRVVGCRATEDVVLRLDDVGALEEVLTAVVASEPATLNGPNWMLKDPDAARRTAQARAVADARDRAEGYAAALGGRLGALLRLSEAGDGGVEPRAFRMAAMARPRPRPTSASWASNPSRCASPSAVRRTGSCFSDQSDQEARRHRRCRARRRPHPR